MTSQKLNTEDISNRTGLSQRQVARIAKADPLPGQKFVAGKGPGSGYFFHESPALDTWMEAHSLSPEARNAGRRGRRARADYESLTPANSRARHYINDAQSWEIILKEVENVSKLIDRKVRRQLALFKGNKRQNAGRLLTALSPMFILQHDLTKLYIPSRSNRSN